MDRVIVTAVHNPFDPLGNKETRLLEARKTVREYVAEFYPEAIREGYDLAISIDGVIAKYGGSPRPPGEGRPLPGLLPRAARRGRR